MEKRWNWIILKETKTYDNNPVNWNILVTGGKKIKRDCVSSGERICKSTRSTMMKNVGKKENQSSNTKYEEYTDSE